MIILEANANDFAAGVTEAISILNFIRVTKGAMTKCMMEKMFFITKFKVSSDTEPFVKQTIIGKKQHKLNGQVRTRNHGKSEWATLADGDWCGRVVIKVD